MLRATSIVRKPAVRAERVADTLTLDHADRHRRRIAMTAENGLAFLLDLDKAATIDDGDAVKLEDGRLVLVRAAPEKLIEITTGNAARLMRVAWHVGNRHVAAEIGPDAIFIAYDHVLLEMVRGLGATAREVFRPFQPEKGAYEGGHGHDHGHDHGHAYDHGDHAHGHAHAGGHGDGCGCGHDHGHAHSHAHGHAEAHAHSHSHGHSHAHSHSHSGHGGSHGAHEHENR